MERRAWLRFERYEIRLPDRLREAIADDAADLLTITAVALARYPKPELEGADFHTSPPRGLFDKDAGADHGQWLEELIRRVIEPLERYASDGRLPSRRAKDGG